MSKYTPGPWKVEDKREETPPGYLYEITTDEANPWQIASIAGGTDANDLSIGAEEKANAQHIVAAPQLLEACEKFVDSFKSLQREKCDIAHEMAKAAIAAAGS